MLKKLKDFLKDWNNQSSYFRWLMHYSKPYVPRILLIMIFNIATTLLSVAMAVVSKHIIDSATEKHNLLLWAVAVYGLMILVNIAIGVVTNLIAIMLNEKFSFGIRKQVYESIIRSHWMDIKKYHTGDLMTRLTSDAGNISDGIIYVIPTIIQLIVELFATFFTLFYYEPLLAIFALFIAPLASVAAFWLGRKLKILQKKVQESESRYRSFIQESFANLLVVKSFANEEYSIQRLIELRDDRFKWVYKRSKVSLMSSTVIGLSFQVGYIVAFAYGAMQVSTKAITYGTMSVFLTLVNRIQSPVMGLAQQVPKIISILTSAGRIIEIENIQLEERVNEHIPHEQIGIEVNHMSFGYTDETILEDISLRIHPGEFIAVVGESGIGKTTLVRLVMAFLNEMKGEIFFTNNCGQKEKVNAGVREFISYVPQGNTLFSGTIRENLRMGRLDAQEEDMIEALKMASAYEFIKGLPDGLDTVIGERGHGISEGQAQRVAIARALIRKTPLLILDEATSSLDAQTELQVLDNICKLEPRPTCLLITHRKTVLPYCDRKITIMDGKILEEDIERKD